MLPSRQKIIKSGGAEPDEFETQVAQELLNLEVIIPHLSIYFLFQNINQLLRFTH